MGEGQTNPDGVASKDQPWRATANLGPSESLVKHAAVMRRDSEAIQPFTVSGRGNRTARSATDPTARIDSFHLVRGSAWADRCQGRPECLIFPGMNGKSMDGDASPVMSYERAQRIVELVRS